MENHDNTLIGSEEKEFKSPWWTHTKSTPSITFNAKHNEYNSCDNCSNNPKNGGSGICFCVLGMSGIYC